MIQLLLCQEWSSYINYINIFGHVAILFWFPPTAQMGEAVEGWTHQAVCSFGASGPCPGGQWPLFSPPHIFFQKSRALTGFWWLFFDFHFEIYKFLQPCFHCGSCVIWLNLCIMPCFSAALGPWTWRCNAMIKLDKMLLKWQGIFHWRLLEFPKSRHYNASNLSLSWLIQHRTRWFPPFVPDS